MYFEEAFNESSFVPVRRSSRTIGSGAEEGIGWIRTGLMSQCYLILFGPRTPSPETRQIPCWSPLSPSASNVQANCRDQQPPRQLYRRPALVNNPDRSSPRRPSTEHTPPEMWKFVAKWAYHWMERLFMERHSTLSTFESTDATVLN